MQIRYQNQYEQRELHSWEEKKPKNQNNLQQNISDCQNSCQSAKAVSFRQKGHL